MTLSDSTVKIISAVCVALLTYLLNYLPKFQLFTIFSRLSAADRARLFSLLYKRSGEFLDDYAIQSQMQAYGIKYSPQFMKNLFYYTYKNNIRANDKDLSAFLSLPGLFICKEDGEVRLQKGARLLCFILFFISLFMMIFVASLFPESIGNLPLYLAQQHYFLLTLQAASVLVSIIGVMISLVLLYTLLFRSLPAFRFARGYQAAWKRRDLFERSEQNLYCGNAIRK